MQPASLSKHSIFCGLAWVVLIVFLFTVGPDSILSSAAANLGWTTLMRDVAAETNSLPTSPSAKWFQRALRINPHNRSARRGLGIALAQQGDERGAVAVLQTIDGMGRELYHMGQQADRSQIWWITNPELAPAELAQSDHAQRPDPRHTWYNLATQVDPTLRDVWYHLARIYEEEQRWTAANDAYKNGLFATESLEIQSSDMHFGMGRNLELHSAPPRVEEAMQHYEKAIADNAFGDPWVAVQTHFRRAQILIQWQRFDEAANELEYVIAQRPKSYWALTDLAALNHEQFNDDAEAETLLKRAIALSPTIHYAYRELGKLYQQQQHWADAKTMFETALQHSPTDAQAAELLQVVLKEIE